MSKTPPGYTVEPFRYCSCTTEAERLICCAADLKWRIGFATRVLPPPCSGGDPGPFRLWVYQLCIDLTFAPPNIGFRAIMEGWTRARILLHLRREGATNL